MKKLLIAMLAMLSLTAQAQTKCDWSGYWMIKSFNNQNYFQFRTNLHNDNCVDYVWLVYDYQLKRTDTIHQEIVNGVMGVQFNVKGKYKVGIHALNKCTKCDTNFVYNVDITIYGAKVKLEYNVSDTNCRAYTFEMSDMKDSCYLNYYYEIWDATEFASKMTDQQWKEVSDSVLYFTYEWKKLKYYSSVSERLLKYTFKDSGRYIVTTFWSNRCTGIDTWIYNKIVVCPTERTTSTKDLIKNSDVRIIGSYDMMGRQVEYMRPNEIYIIIYSNGQRRKVMQVQN